MKRFSVLLIGVASMVGCGGGDGGGGGSPPTITAVTISGDSTVSLAGTLQLTATAQAGGQTINNCVTFQWSSSDQNKATVSSTGVVSGMQRGTADITAQAVLNGTATGVTSPAHTVRVRIASIAVTPTTPASLNYVGETQTFSAEPRDATGAAVPGLTITWSTNNAVLGIVPGAGSTGVATAAARTNQGGITVRVRAAADGVTDSSVTILVRQIPKTVALVPNSFSTLTALGQKVIAACAVLDSGGDTIPVHPCGWSVQPTDSGVVTFSPTTGASTQITARKNGDANIRATAFPSLFAPNVVQVRQAPARIKLHPMTVDTSRILTLGTMRFIDSVYDANDSLLRAPAPTITWSSSTTSATVDANGLVTAGATVGSTYIKAVNDTVEDSAYVEIMTTAITLSAIVQPIFTSQCASCHDGVGGALPGVLNLTATNTFANTVGVTSIQSALKRVLASVPDSSYLVHKIQGTYLQPPSNGLGSRMPLGGASLPKHVINAIRNWSLQGALNN